MRYSPFQTFPDAAQDAAIWIRQLAELLGCEHRVGYDVLRVTRSIPCVTGSPLATTRKSATAFLANGIT